MCVRVVVCAPLVDSEEGGVGESLDRLRYIVVVQIDVYHGIEYLAIAVAIPTQREPHTQGRRETRAYVDAEHEKGRERGRRTYGWPR